MTAAPRGRAASPFALCSIFIAAIAVSLGAVPAFAQSPAGVLAARVVGLRDGRLVLDRGRAAGVQDGDSVHRVACDPAQAGPACDPDGGVEIGVVTVLTPDRAEVDPVMGIAVAAGDEVRVVRARRDATFDAFTYEQRGQATVALAPGDEVEAGTCGMVGASGYGDTTLTLRAPDGSLAAMNDDVCGLRSHFVYRVPVNAGGLYTVVAGCYGGSAPCGGTVAVRRHVTRAGTPVRVPFAAGPRADGAPTYTSVRVTVSPGEELRATTCGAPRRGRTRLALHGPDGERAAPSERACDGGQSVAYADPWQGAERWLRADCEGGSCEGVIEHRTSPSTDGFTPRWHFAASARGLYTPGARGAAVFGDAEVVFRAARGIALRLEGWPLALGAGGFAGGVYALGARAVVGVHWEGVEVGLGGGAVSLNQRLANSRASVAPEASLLARFGFDRGPWIETSFGMTFVSGRPFGTSFRMRAGVRFSRVVEGTLNAGYTIAGVGYGEFGLTYWARGDGLAPGSVGLSATAGGAAVWYQPACALGPCPESTTYAGPSLGIGAVFRP